MCIRDRFQYFAAEPVADEASDKTLRTLEKRQIRTVLQETGGNKMEAARQLGIGTKTLYRKIQEYGL